MRVLMLNMVSVAASVLVHGQLLMDVAPHAALMRHGRLMTFLRRAVKKMRIAQKHLD